jgi:hypothetical protein
MSRLGEPDPLKKASEYPYLEAFKLSHGAIIGFDKLL